MTAYTREDVAELFKQTDNPGGESWRPEEPGEKVAGRVLRHETRTTERGEANVLILERYPDKAEVVIWRFHAALDRELTEKGVQVGDLIAIHYVGKSETKDGRGFFKYVVARKAVPKGGETAATEPATAEKPAPVSTGDVPF